MLSIRLRSDAVPVRFLSLDVGEHLFGAGVYADHVLLDPSIRDEHFKVSFKDGIIKVCLLPRFDSAVADADTGESPIWQTLEPGLELELDGVYIMGFYEEAEVIDRAGVDQDTQSLKASSKRRPKGQIGRVFLTGPAAWFGSFVFLIAAPSIFVALAMPAERTANGGQDLMSSYTTLATFNHRRNSNTGELERLGAANETLKNKSEQADYSANTEARSPPTTEPHAEAGVIRQAKKLLQSFNADAASVTLEAAQMTITGDLPSPAVRQQITKTLVEDITTVQEVRFKYLPKDNWRALRKDIEGVWVGDNPYIILRSEGRVQEGETFHQYYVLEIIHRDGIVVSVAGEKQEIEF